MKQDRFLLGILIGIGLLVVAAVGIFFVRRTSLGYGPEDSPAGVLRNYIVAMEKNDYQRAYGYLAEDTNKPTYDTFRQALLLHQINPETASMSLGKTSISGDEALIDITIINSSGDPFNAPNRNLDRGLLKNQGGNWKIRTLPYPYFNWDWYQPNAPQEKTVPAVPAPTQ
jgi:hypothetical protein